MKILLAAVTLLLASAAKAELPCQLTDNDYASLAASDSKLNADGVKALAPKKQSLLCNSRAFLNVVDQSHGKINKIDTYSPFYLSPAERSRVNKAVDALLQSQLSQKGIEIA